MPGSLHHLLSALESPAGMADATFLKLNWSIQENRLKTCITPFILSCTWHIVNTLSCPWYNQGGLKAGVPTRYNEFQQLSVFYGHTKALYRCSGVFDARCSMPPISWEEMKMDFISDRIFHLVFDQTKLFYTL